MNEEDLPEIDEKYKEQLYDALNSSLSGPKHLQITPTNECNLRCVYCWRQHFNTWESNLSEEKLLEISKQAVDLNPETITITGGGEPLVNRDTFVKMMETIRENSSSELSPENYKDSRSVKGEVITNGTLITRKVARKMADLNWDVVSFSLNSADERTEDFLKGRKGTFKKTIDSVEFLNEFRDDLPVIKFNSVISKFNYDQVSDLVKLAGKYSADVQLRLVNEPPETERPMCVPNDRRNEFRNELGRAEEIADEDGVEIFRDFTDEDLRSFLDMEDDAGGKGIAQETKDSSGLSEKELLEKLRDGNIDETLLNNDICVFPFAEMNVFGDGMVAPCGGFFPGTDWEYPDKDKKIIESCLEKDLEEIWYGDKFNRIRVLMLMDTLPRACKACNINFINVSRIFRENLNEDGSRGY